MNTIDWHSFIRCCRDNEGCRHNFESLSRQVFQITVLDDSYDEFIKCSPNNPGLESEPVLDKKSGKYIGFQSKFFDNGVDYAQIKHSCEVAVNHYAGRLDKLILFCNHDMSLECDSYKNIVK